ncbi:MAG: DNA gyrase C-terminal beta-propeller domain-containing protein, partial [Selenomonadaceae bacterium]
KGYDIPESTRQAKGTAIVNLLPLSAGETITAVIPVRDFRDDRYLFMATKKGVVKRTVLMEYGKSKTNGLAAIRLDDDDELIGVKQTKGEQQIVLGTRDGLAIIFNEEDVRVMGRTARGVYGIHLRDMDEVVGMDTIVRDSEIFTVTEEGFGKRTKAGEYRLQTRGGKGLINMKVTERTGAVVGLKVVHEGQEILLITTDGIVIRTNIDEVSIIGRNTQGVKVIKTEEGDKVASFAVMDAKE